MRKYSPYHKSIMSFLSQIRIVLVEPSHPGNIGSVARAMKTMGLSNLVLVNPKKFPHVEASKLAAGADSVLQDAKVVPTISEAIGDCTMVLGTSVRDREVTWPTFDPRQTASLVSKHLATVSADNSVAVLFGRESSGLTNAEMDLCQSQIRISANVEYSSLNLASAVQIIAYEMRMQANADSAGLALNEGAELASLEKQALTPAQKRQQVATKLQQEKHLEHLQNTLESLEFVKVKPPTVLMRKLTRLYSKADLSVEEIQILRGIYSAMQNKMSE